jgi:hypothetical protein
MADPNSRPRIGDFRSKPDNAPRKAAPEVAAGKAEDGVKDAPVEDKASEDAEKTEAEMTPKERYAQRLKDANIPLHIAQAIFDAVVSKGYYEEYVKVGAGRATLRTRLYDDHLRLQTALEAARPGLVLTQEDMITRYNLAASLYEWKGKAYKHDTDDDFDAVMDEVKRLPAPIYSLMVQRLAEFDRKVMLVFSDGATDSF